MQQSTTSELQEFLKSVDGFQLLHNKVVDIIANFRFDRVQETMEHLNWQWAYWEDELGEVHRNQVPSVYALRQCALRLLSQAISGGEVSTGGLRATITYLPEEELPEDKLPISLEFILEEETA